MEQEMNRKYLVSILAALLLTFFSISVRAAINDEREDTDTRFIDAQVVEVADGHISVIARSGVEHVIAIDNLKTKVTIDDQEVSLKDVREGDIITIELDEQNPMKFARVISMTAEQVQVARVRR
jgi:type II secretory pathway pseudopilin PulG